MEIPDELCCVFTSTIKKQNGSYVIEVPDREITLGDVGENGTYRVALLSGTPAPEEKKRQKSETESKELRDPPVEEGDQRTVEIEDIGEKGDGIARVERGYVVIVPETKQGERVTVEISNVKENLAFGEVVNARASANN